MRILAGHIYCGRRCQLVDTVHSVTALAGRTALLRVPPAWSITLVVALATLLTTSVAIHIAELLETNQELMVIPSAVGHLAPRPLDGRLFRADERWQLEISGPPRGTILLVQNGQPIAVVPLDTSGRGTYSGLRFDDDRPMVELVTLGRSTVAVRAVPTPLPGTPAPVIADLARTPPPEPPPIRRTWSPEEEEARRLSPPILHLVPDAGARIGLTFDGGRSSDGSVGLLDMLRSLDLRVTMFLTGAFVEANPAVVRRAVLEGHEIGNHTYSHPHLTTYAHNRAHNLLPHVNRAWFRRQLQLTEEAFFRATGKHMAPLWRAPYGEESSVLRGWAMELGYLHVRWSSLRGKSLDAWDWVDDEHSSLYQNSPRIMERLLRFPRLDGGIVLMHLSSRRQEPPWRALPQFLRALEARGIEPVQITTLLEASETWRPRLEEAARRQRERVSGAR